MAGSTVADWVSVIDLTGQRVELLLKKVLIWSKVTVSAGDIPISKLYNC